MQGPCGVTRWRPWRNAIPTTRRSAYEAMTKFVQAISCRATLGSPGRYIRSSNRGGSYQYRSRWKTFRSIDRILTSPFERQHSCHRASAHGNGEPFRQRGQHMQPMCTAQTQSLCVQDIGKHRSLRTRPCYPGPQSDIMLSYFVPLECWTNVVNITKVMPSRAESLGLACRVVLTLVMTLSH